MRINITESKLAQVAICLLILALVAGANFLIYKYREPASGRGMKNAGIIASVFSRAPFRLGSSAFSGEGRLFAESLLPQGGEPSKEGRARLRPDWIHELVRTVAQSDSSLRATWFIGTDGDVLASAGMGQPTPNLAHTKYFKKAMRGKYASEILRVGSPAESCLVSAAPVEIDGKIIGVLCVARVP